MKRIGSIAALLISLCAAVCIAAPPETLTLADLANHPERWPATVALGRDLKMRSGAVLHQGDKMHVEAFDGQKIGVSGANNVRIRLTPADCDLLDAANRAWAALTPAKRAIDPGSIIADPSLWPGKVALPDGMKSTLGNLPAGTEADLLTVAADGITIVYPNSVNKIKLEIGLTDLIERARALAATDSEKRPSRIAAALKPMLVDSDAKPYRDEHLADKKLFAFYYGAGWCVPCREASPDFVRFANAAVQAHPELAVVFMSNDKDNSGMTQYMKEEKMAFPAVELKDIDKSALLLSYAAEMIPHLIVVDRFGKVLADSDANGRRVEIKQTTAELDKLLSVPISH